MAIIIVTADGGRDERPGRGSVPGVYGDAFHDTGRIGLGGAHQIRHCGEFLADALRTDRRNARNATQLPQINVTERSARGRHRRRSGGAGVIRRGARVLKDCFMERQHEARRGLHPRRTQCETAHGLLHAQMRLQNGLLYEAGVVTGPWRRFSAAAAAAVTHTLDYEHYPTVRGAGGPRLQSG